MANNYGSFYCSNFTYGLWARQWESYKTYKPVHNNQNICIQIIRVRKAGIVSQEAAEQVIIIMCPYTLKLKQFKGKLFFFFVKERNILPLRSCDWRELDSALSCLILWLLWKVCWNSSVKFAVDAWHSLIIWTAVLWLLL